MMSTLAAAVALGTFASGVVVVWLGRRRPLALSLAIAYALVVAFEAVLAPVLSSFHAYARAPVLAAHAVAILTAAVVAFRSRRVRDAAARAVRSLRMLGTRNAAAALPLVALAALLAIIAAAYAPNNWDSMTYRLARIAHWIQHRSVAPYPTAVNRQVALAPGAEYVLGAWQVVAGTDRLANFLQLAGWAVTALAAAPLLRIAGASRAVARLGVAVAAAVPMAVLQATSTQNDLVAAAACAGLIAASLPLSGHCRIRTSDAALVGATLAVATLVKPTVAVAAAPFVAWAFAVRVRRAMRVRGEARVLLRGAGAAAAIAAVIVLPDAAVRLRDRGVREANASYATMYLYPLAGEPGDRLLNVVRGIGRHFPLPRIAREALGRPVPAGCADGLRPCRGEELDAHEDSRGNPLHVVFFVALAAVAAIRARRLPRRGLVLLALTAASWLLFQLVFRDNPWITRLESPTFALSPLALVALARLDRRTATGIAAVAAALLLAVGIETALANQLRPVRGWRAALRDRDGYYAHHPALRPLHDEALAEARRRGCRRLGLRIGGDSWDYPLTWRAMRSGMETRHVFGADPWPCLVFVDGAPAAPAEWEWTSVGTSSLFENGLAKPSRSQ